MPVPAYQQPPPQPPPLTLPSLPILAWEGIVDEARGLFDNIAYYWDQLLFPEKFRKSLRDAWGEVRELFSTYRNNITGNVQESLRQIGFAGAQLALKLAAMNDIWSRFYEYGIRFLKELLEGLSVCFDSLSKVFPQLGAVKEFVDFAKWAYSLSEQWVASQMTSTSSDAKEDSKIDINVPNPG